MPVYGYQRRGSPTPHGLIELRELTFQMKPTNLRAVAAFLLECADRIEGGRWDSDHAHMPDSPPGVEVIVIH